MSVRESFANKFGEEQALAVEAAAEEHRNGLNDRNKGSDPFKWVISIALGYQCMELDGYREYHNITANWDEIKTWIKEECHLETHDGDCDLLGAFCGCYDEFLPIAKEAMN